VADSPGGEWAGDQVDWDWLFVGLVQHLPTLQRPGRGPSGGNGSGPSGGRPADAQPLAA
jgi:hypothetical protein